MNANLQAANRPTRGRDPKHFRAITLLNGYQTRIDPSEYRAHTNLKAFDDDETKILRVHRHIIEQPDKHGKFREIATDHYLVYGRHSVTDPDNRKRCSEDVEAYEVVLNEDMIPAALEAVAKHCGIEDLVP